MLFCCCCCCCTFWVDDACFPSVTSVFSSNWLFVLVPSWH
jgi:hypothetical protein